MKLIDNFLEEKEFNHLRDSMICKDYPFGLQPSPLPWFYNDIIDNPEEERSKFQFTHTFFDDKQPRSGAFQEFAPIFKNIVGGCQLIRVKANLLTRTPTIVQNTFHTDFGVVNKEKGNVFTSLFYINDNNGHTLFEDGTKVESVANRLITFPTDVSHTGTSCTDEKIRVVINFNYMKVSGEPV